MAEPGQPSGTEIVARPRRDPPVPEAHPTIDQYAILRKLAEGGTAKIFIAQRAGEEKICIVKVLHEHLLEHPTVAKRLEREAQLASLLQHPNIARITDAKREKGLFYIAMDFIAGQDVEAMLFKLWGSQKMPPAELSISVTLEVLAAMHYAHELAGPDGKHLEIVHRDLSPRNVMIEYTGGVKVIDFGLARTNLGSYRTAPGMVLGTLRYMSPEQAVASPVDRRSDLYTWSVVLYECLSGRPMIDGASATEILHKVVTHIPPPLSSLNPALPRALDAVLEQGLQKDPRDRFATAEEYRLALAEAARGIRLASREEIGSFVADLFPEEQARSRALMESARSGAGAGEGTQVRLAYEPTRAGAPMPSLPATVPDSGVPGAVVRDAAVQGAAVENAAVYAKPRARSRRGVAWIALGLAVAGASLAAIVSSLRPAPEPRRSRDVLIEERSARPSVQPRAASVEREAVGPRASEVSGPPEAPEEAISAGTKATVRSKTVHEKPPTAEASTPPTRAATRHGQLWAVLAGLRSRDDAEAFDRARKELQEALNKVQPESDAVVAINGCRRRVMFLDPKSDLAVLEECLRTLESMEK